MTTCVGDARHTVGKQDLSQLSPVGGAFGEKDDIVSTSVVSGEIECTEGGSIREAVSFVSHTNVEFSQETVETANSLPVDKEDAACFENEERKPVGETTESGSKDVCSIPVSRESDEPGGPDVNTGTDDTRASGAQGNTARKRSRPTRTSRGKTSERKKRNKFKEKNEAKEGIPSMHARWLVGRMVVSWVAEMSEFACKLIFLLHLKTFTEGEILTRLLSVWQH